jgi:hypothetical protein
MPFRKEPHDDNLFEGDIQRLFTDKYMMDPAEKEQLQEQFDKVSDDVLLTQQFLVLQNIRIDDQMPGGANCTYADSWFTGGLWEKGDDEFQWTRAAWLQLQRARTWHEMPNIWKRIMRNAWEDFQDFLAMLALSDGGKSTAKYREHEQAWGLVRAAYMSNLNRRTTELHAGSLAEEIARRKAAAQPFLDRKTKETGVNTILEYCGYKLVHMARQLAGMETEEDKMKLYESTEVQLFGIPLFNTKDAVSERLWSMATSQGPQPRVPAPQTLADTQAHSREGALCEAPLLCSNRPIDMRIALGAQARLSSDGRSRARHGLPRSLSGLA